MSSLQSSGGEKGGPAPQLYLVLRKRGEQGGCSVGGDFPSPPVPFSFPLTSPRYSFSWHCRADVPPTAGGQPSPSKGGGVTSPGLVASGATDVVTQRRVITSPASTQADVLLPSDPPPLASRYAPPFHTACGESGQRLKVKGAEAMLRRLPLSPRPPHLDHLSNHTERCLTPKQTAMVTAARARVRRRWSAARRAWAAAATRASPRRRAAPPPPQSRGAPRYV